LCPRFHHRQQTINPPNPSPRRRLGPAEDSGGNRSSVLR
jgi:hypothetical protein